MDCETSACKADSLWFAVWTRSRQEKVAASVLETLGIQHFLPLRSEVRQWSDRKQTATVPLFSSYLFVRMNLAKDAKLQVLKARGIVSFVGNATGPLPIPDQEIDAIRTVLNHQIECTVMPLLKEGELVRVVRGTLAGVEGRLIHQNSTSRLLISVEMIHKAISVNVLRQDVEPLQPSGLN